MNAMDPRLEGCLLTRFLDALVYIAPRLFHHFLNAGRMDAPVCNQPLQSNAGNLALHGIEPRQYDRLRRIINDEVNARQRFQRPDIASLAPNDAPFHLIIRQSHNGHRRLCNMICRTALDCLGKNLPCLLVSLILCLLLILLDFDGLFVLQLFFRLCHEQRLCFLDRKIGDAFQLRLLLFMQFINGSLRPIKLRLFPGKRLLLLLQRIQFPVQVFLLLDNAPFLALKLIPALLGLLVQILAQAMDILLRLQHSFLFSRFAFFFSVCYNPSCFFLGGSNLRLCRPLARNIAADTANKYCENSY